MVNQKQEAQTMYFLLCRLTQLFFFCTSSFLIFQDWRIRNCACRKDLRSKRGSFCKYCIDRNRYVLATNVTELGMDNEVFIYGLSYFNYTTKTVIKQICQIKKYEDPQLRLVTSSVQQLSNHVDCVIVSICDSLSY